MQYVSHYSSPLGAILLAADDIGLTGLWFEGQKYFALHLDPEREERELPLFETAKRWLDLYFSGKEPDFSVPLHFTGTDFQNEVWRILRAVPYGQTTTYGEIAASLPGNGAFRTCRPRPTRDLVWAATGFPSSCPATGSWERTAA